MRARSFLGPISRPNTSKTTLPELVLNSPVFFVLRASFCSSPGITAASPEKSCTQLIAASPVPCFVDDYLVAIDADQSLATKPGCSNKSLIRV